MIAVEEMPSVSPRPDGRRARRTGVVSRGTRVYLRTLRPEDLEYLADWAEDPFLERMVGSEFLNTYKHVYDKDPSFYEACLMDSTQIVLVIEAEPEWASPLGIARLFNIHLLEGYASGIWGGGRQADLVLWGRRAGASAYRGQSVRVQSAERQLATAQWLPAGGHPPQGRIPGWSVLGHARLRHPGTGDRTAAQEGPGVSPSRRSRGGRA